MKNLSVHKVVEIKRTCRLQSYVYSNAQFLLCSHGCALHLAFRTIILWGCKMTEIVDREVHVHENQQMPIK